MNKILVIDDDEELRRTVRMMLAAGGYEVIEAEDGLAGVKLARTELPDLILSDVQMGRLDGYATLNVVRLHPATAGIPLILMTGQANFEGMRRGMSLGADDYLVKPISAAILLETVKVRLKKRVAALEEAEQKVGELRSNLSSMLPHELLTPLNGIMGLADIITASAADLPPEQIAEFSRDISQCGERLHHLINNFIAYAEIELVEGDAGKINALRQAAPTELEKPTQLAAEKAATAWKRAGDLKLTLSPTRAPIATEHYNALVRELIDNAFKFSKPGSEVCIQLSETAEEISLTVSDQGRGMSAMELARVGAFMQFGRKIHEQQGAGLGLVTAKRWAEIYGGRLNLSSEPAKRTTAQLVLPKQHRS